jgi:hypothetical protein
MPLQSPPSPTLAQQLLHRPTHLVFLLALLALGVFSPSTLGAQGVTTSAINGFVTSEDGRPLEEAVIVAVHVPSGTQYRTGARTAGAYSLLNGDHDRLPASQRGKRRAQIG